MSTRVMCLMALAVPVWAQTGVGPLLDCVTLDMQNNVLTATWGYLSTNGTNTIIPFGPNNLFSPPPANQGQPTTFAPGTHHAVFQTTFSLATVSSQTWTLGGISATASNDPGLYCSGSSVACWDVNGNHVCDPAEDINGDGVCDARDCQGRPGIAGTMGVPGPQGPIGPTGPVGPSGISQTTRIVTVPTSAATATASCNSNELMLTGGGTCAVPNTNTISGRIASSGPVGVGTWSVSCSTGQATAVAVCALKQ